MYLLSRFFFQILAVWFSGGARNQLLTESLERLCPVTFRLLIDYDGSLRQPHPFFWQGNIDSYHPSRSYEMEA